MTVCVGNYFRLASLPLLRKITECGNYCEASPDMKHFLPVTGACSGQRVSLCQHFAAWLCTILLSNGQQSLGRLHQDPTLCKQVHDWPSAQTGLNNPSISPRGNGSLCCSSLGAAYLSMVHQHTSANPESANFMVFSPILHPWMVAVDPCLGAPAMPWPWPQAGAFFSQHFPSSPL